MALITFKRAPGPAPERSAFEAGRKADRPVQGNRILGGAAMGLGFPRKETKVKVPGSREAARMLGWALSHLISRETAPPTPPEVPELWGPLHPERPRAWTINAAVPASLASGLSPSQLPTPRSPLGPRFPRAGQDSCLAGCWELWGAPLVGHAPK